MEKYKELLKYIICETIIDKTDFVDIDNMVFDEKGVMVYYEYYLYSNNSETEIDSIFLFNSELNAYIYEKLN